MPETFEEMVARERERLTKLKDDAEARLKEIQEEIAEIDREFEAIDAYEAVKAGKSQTNKKLQKSKEPGESGQKRAPRGSRQKALLDLIGRSSDGLTRAEIIEEFGAKGDKKAEASISNALASMKKGGELRSEGKRYLVVPE